MTIDYATLKAECQTNPNGYTFTDQQANTTQTLVQWFAAGADAVCADILNKIRSTIDIARSNVTPQEVIEAIAINQFAANITTIQSSWFESFIQLPTVQLLKVAANGTVSDTRVMNNLLLLLTNGSSSETRLRALATRKGSRAEQLFGEGIMLSASDITTARNS